MYDDIVQALRHCAENDCSPECPRFGIGRGCISGLALEAADAIEALAQECESSVARATDAEEALRKRRPVVRGRWVDGGKSVVFPNDVIYRCSECDCRYFMMHHYCPNCGADMREAAPTIIPAELGEEEKT